MSFFDRSDEVDDLRSQLAAEKERAMSRYRCYKCETEHGTDNMVAYCAACYSDLRSQLAAEKERALKAKNEARAAIMRADSAHNERADVLLRLSAETSNRVHMDTELVKLEVRAEAAEDALAKERERADAAEDTAASAFDGMRLAKNRADAAESQVAALTKERNALINSTGEHITVRSDYQEKIAALTEKLEAAKRLTAPHLQEYALRLEEENKTLTEKVAGLVAVMLRSGFLKNDKWGLTPITNTPLEDAPAYLAAHDAATQKELVEALKKSRKHILNQLDPVAHDTPREHFDFIDEVDATLAKYAGQSKEGA